MTSFASSSLATLCFFIYCNIIVLHTICKSYCNNNAEKQQLRTRNASVVVNMYASRTCSQIKKSGEIALLIFNCKSHSLQHLLLPRSVFFLTCYYNVSTLCVCYGIQWFQLNQTSFSTSSNVMTFSVFLLFCCKNLHILRQGAVKCYILLTTVAGTLTECWPCLCFNYVVVAVIVSWKSFLSKNNIGQTALVAISE